MMKKIIAVSIVPSILIICIVALVLITGCNSTATKSPPQPITSTIPVTIVPATTPPPLTTGGTCRQGLTWCNDHCTDLSAAIGDCGACGVICPTGQSCVSGTCCTKGLSLCNGLCSDLATDVKNCGSCQNACPNGSVCYYSKCVNRSIECPTGQTLCFDERCYDLTTDNMNCGSCGHVCPPFSGCTEGICVDMEGDYIPGDIVIHMPL